MVVSLSVDGPPPPEDDLRTVVGGPGLGRAAGRGLPTASLGAPALGLGGPVRGIGGPGGAIMQPPGAMQPGQAYGATRRAQNNSSELFPEDRAPFPSSKRKPTRRETLGEGERDFSASFLERRLRLKKTGRGMAPPPGAFMPPPPGMGMGARPPGT